MNLTGKNVLVTGATATSGVGHGAVLAVLEAGGVPVVNGRRDESIAEFRQRHPDCPTVLGDVSNAEDADRMVREAFEQCGTIHGLVNNAGVGLYRAPHECDEEEFDSVAGVDLKGSWLMTRAWIRELYRRNPDGAIDGAIVNITSVHAQKTAPGYALYAGFKGGVESLTRGLAVHYGARGIRANAVAPGYVHSRQNLELMKNWTDQPGQWCDDLFEHNQALRRPIEPLDVGRVVAFLLSDASRGMTGQVLTVDAGNTSLLFPNDFI